MSLHSARQLVLGFMRNRRRGREIGGSMSSDGGLLVIREFDERLKFTERWRGRFGFARSDLHAAWGARAGSSAVVRTAAAYEEPERSR